MTDTSRPITPTRVIPAGAPLPPRPPDPDEEPPWWHQRKAPAPPSPRAPASAAPSDPPPPIQVHVTVDLTPVEEPPPPTRTQRVVDWLWDRCTDWRLLSAVLAALAPWLNGTSPAGAWAATLHDARTEAGLPAAYLLAAAALGITWAINRRGRWAGRFSFTVAFVGALGVLDPYDLVFLLTGVPR
ncbi:hypothetical protein Salbus254_5919 [Streptomyces albidoflavus]|uniref:hypothetical protein n=1 Tax=Streptomyces albidoflavus TaxID=1886 RepID=UPI00078CAA31|nr:hypothetical protein [Streptomyces albidoflavus]AMM12347.1 hypothetical protein Salbus254_5919 [Streptomyces albidoflavus]